MLQRRREDEDTDSIQCPVRQILGRMGGRWTLDIVMLLGEEPKHFAELDRRIAKISRRMLTLTLRALERDGLLERQRATHTGSVVQYQLTELGWGLHEHFQAITDWSRRERQAIYAARERYDSAT